MLCRVDSTNLHCHQRLWINSTSTFLPSSVTGKKHQTLCTCIHAELRLIPHLGPPPLYPAVHPIGVGKRSCICCVLWIESQSHFWNAVDDKRISWQAICELGASRCRMLVCNRSRWEEQMGGADGRSSVDVAVLKAIWTRLTDTLALFFPGQKKISDNHFSSRDESSGGEQGESEWRRRLAALAPPPHG